MRSFCIALAQHVSPIVGQPPEEIAGLFSAPPDAALGDIALPCFHFSKTLRRDPKSIAATIAGLSYGLPWLRGATAAGPYVNYQLEPPAFAAAVLPQVFRAPDAWGTSREGAGQTIVIDYSSPNVAKHLAVHHLRSTMIGNALANLHRALGYTVVGVNHVGDWGTSFAKLLCAWERFGIGPAPLAERDDPITDLNDLYVRFHDEAEKDPTLEEEARRWFKLLESGDATARARWQEIRDVSLKRFERVYERLGVRFEAVMGESFFEDLMQPVIDELARKGLLRESDDAQVVFLDEWGMPPMLIRKKDGTTLYGTRDLAAADERWRRWHFERCYYVVDAGQSLHFRQLFQVLRLLGREYADRMEHLEFGVMRLPVDGRWVRGKTRKGQVVLLERVLDVARDLAREKILKKNPDLEDIDDAAEAVGIGSVILSDLKAKRGKDVNFDLDQITSFEGETGAYLQYTHVRLCGILRNYSGPPPEGATGATLASPQVVALLKGIASFPDVLVRAAAEREPSVVSQYLLELCGHFNSFYAVHRILDADPAVARDGVGLVLALRTVIHNGLRILGIRPLERM